MKQIIVIFIVFIGIYFMYNHGFIKTIVRPKANPEAIEEKPKVNPEAEPILHKQLPAVAPERNQAMRGSSDALSKVESSCFSLFDPPTSYAFVEIAYFNGAPDISRIINRYLANYNMPEDRAKILNLLSSVRDKQTFDVLVDFFNRNIFPKKTLLHTIADFDSSESFDFLKNVAKENTNAALRKEAMDIIKTVEDSANLADLSEQEQDPTRKPSYSTVQVQALLNKGEMKR